MPTYQYACTECGHAFEQVQSFSDDALTTCPECQGRLRKVFNAVGVVFKGSGFYRNDSRGKDTSSESSSSSSSSSTSIPGCGRAEGWIGLGTSTRRPSNGILALSLSESDSYA